MLQGRPFLFLNITRNMMLSIATAFLILTFCVVVVRSEESSGSTASFEGKLPYLLYSTGDGCVESNSVGTGSILSLETMDEPNTFCETDVLDPFPPEFPDPITVYTKIELDCSQGMLAADDAVGVKFWDCSTSDCSDCNNELFAAGSTNVGNFTAARDNLTECFYGWPSFPSDGSNIPVIGYQTFDETMGATQSQDEEFFNVLIENSCLSGNTGDDTTSDAASDKFIHGFNLLICLATGTILSLIG